MSMASSAPTTPSLPAVPDAQNSAATAGDRVIEEIGAVLSSTVSSDDVRCEAAHALWGIRHAAAGSALVGALGDANQAVRLSAAAALLAGDDLRGLPIAETTLRQAVAGEWSESLHNLRVAIAQGVRNSLAIPSLGVLLDSRDIETRRAASEAFRYMRSESALSLLIDSLDDPDLQVRHNAVLGLATLTRQTEWGPSLDAFRGDVERYVGHWREWSRSR